MRLNRSSSTTMPLAASERPSFVSRLSLGLREGWTRSRTSLPPGSPGFFRRNALVLVLAFVVSCIVAAPPVVAHARATAFLLRLGGEAPAYASMVESDVVTERLDLPADLSAANDGLSVVHARLYRPSAPLFGKPRGIVLAHGVHYLGIDEPRLMGLARSFAQAGLVVLTPELAPLADYHVDDPKNLETLRVSVRWLARRTDLVDGHGVGLVGISFAGGLSLRVASEDAIGADLAYVVSIGGHHDMRRIARFFASDTAETPSGTIAWRAHDYGMAVLVFDAPERFVSSEDAPQLRVAVRAYLHESYALAEQEALKLSPQGRAVFERVSHRDTQALAPQLLAAMPDLSQPMAEASPVGRMAKIRVPVFLLHGAHDNVVPPSESQWAALEAKDNPNVHLLVTAKIGHAELGDDAGPWATAELVHFMSQLLDD
jgi:dienelactone hydrolase